MPRRPEVNGRYLYLFRDLLILETLRGLRNKAATLGYTSWRRPPSQRPLSLRPLPEPSCPITKALRKMPRFQARSCLLRE
jgi:hypothetical protein